MPPRFFLSLFVALAPACADLDVDSNDALDDAEGGPGGKADGFGASALETVVSELRDQTPFVADATSLYYVASVWSGDEYLGASIDKVGKAGGAPERITAPASIRSMLAPLALVDAQLYYFVDVVGGDGESHSQLTRVSTSGGGSSILLDGVIAPSSLAADRSGVYFTRRPDDDTFTYEVVALGGVAGTVLATGLHTPQGLALDGGHVYWADMGVGNPAIGCTPGEGVIARVAKIGGAVRTLARGQGCPLDLAIDATRLYWTNTMPAPLFPGASTRPTLMSVAKTGGFAMTRATGALNVAVDGQYLYWTSDMGTLVRMRTLFGYPTVLAEGGAELEPVIDASHVYFFRAAEGGEQHTGSIERVARP